MTKTYNLSFYVAGIFIALSGLLLLVLPALGTYKRYKALKKPLGQNGQTNPTGKLPTIQVSNTIFKFS